MKLELIVWTVIAASGQEDVVRFGATVVIPGGLQGEIYNIKKYSTQLPNVKKKKPVATLFTSSLNMSTHDFRAGLTDVTKRFEWFAINFTGRFWIEKPGAYRFILKASDGSRICIDGQVIVHNDLEGTIEKNGSIYLTGGVHQIQVYYFQPSEFGTAVVLEVEGPGKPRRIFSTDDFRPPSTLEILPAVIPR